MAAVAAGFAAFAPDVAAQDAQRVVIAAFEGAPKTLRLDGVDMQHGVRPGGGNTLALAMPEGATSVGVASVAVPADVGWRAVRALSAWVKVAPAGNTRVFRWRALDGAGEAIFQCRFEAAGTGLWTRMEWPLAAWRWGSARCGRWSEVRRLEIRVERARTKVEFDDWALEPATGELELEDRGALWLGEVAFAVNGTNRLLQDKLHGITVATDLPAAKVSTQELGRLQATLVQAGKWLERMGGEAVRPAGSRGGATLLLFAEQAEYQQFFVRLGAAWGANIAPPKAGGLALEDFAASSWDPVKGVERPVFLHETIHAIVAQRWRIAPRLKGADWVQEGTANYLQLCVYPDSMPRTGWKEWLGKPVGERGGPAPFAKLMSGSIPMRQYPQVAAIIGWLVAKHPGWMPGLIRDLADGEGPQKAFEGRGTTLQQAETEWKTWFDATLVPLKAEDERHFPLPPEFQK
ncbi:MAG: hypothetical protein ACYTGX_15745 [Planctomycetota bacterium]